MVLAVVKIEETSKVRGGCSCCYPALDIAGYVSLVPGVCDVASGCCGGICRSNRYGEEINDSSSLQLALMLTIIAGSYLSAGTDFRL